MLGHKGVSEHYLDYKYIEEQRQCYEKWCDYILDKSLGAEKKG